MFFILSKTLGYLCYPLTMVFVALLLFARTRQREKPAWRWFWAAVLLLWFCSAPWGADLLMRPLERPYLAQPSPAQADVILVLGGSVDLTNCSTGLVSYAEGADRFFQSVKLARRLPQAVLIFAGGTIDMFGRGSTEASVLKAEAEQFGIAPERIRTDDRSRNTHENAVEAKRILETTGGSRVVVVTSAFHMRRALACLRKVGIEAQPYAVDFRGHHGVANRFGLFPQASVLDESTSAVREYFGLLVYRLKGYL